MSQAPRQSCPNCFNNDLNKFLDDEQRGECICMACGLVVQKLLAISEAEWRDFEEDEHSKSRVGAAQSIYSSTGLSTIVKRYAKGTGKNKGTAVKMLTLARNHDELDQHDPATEQIFQVIGQISDIFGFDSAIRASARQVHREFDRQVRAAGGQRRRLKRDGLAAAVVFLACKAEGAPRTFRELSNETNISEKDITKAYKQIARVIPTFVPHRADSDLTLRMCERLGVPPLVARHAAQLAETSTKHFEGRGPATIAAVAISLAVETTGADNAGVTDLAIAELLGIAESTLKMNKNEFKPVLASVFAAGANAADAATASAAAADGGADATSVDAALDSAAALANTILSKKS